MDEACFLADHGFDDLLVAYPTARRGPLRALAHRVARGTRAWAMVDCPAHVDAVAAAARDEGTEIHVALDLDVAWRRLPGVHLGARRSPIRTVADALSVARHAADTDGVVLSALVAYEAHIAGLQDASPFTRATNLPRRWLKRLAIPAVRRLRAEVVAALRDDGHAIDIVHGGGTGSVDSTSADPVVTEVAAGSGFLCPHLFSYFAGLELEPAIFLAFEACRSSDPGYVTCLGGGIVASGEPGWDRLPRPYLPEGLRYVRMEGAGEVQTPLILGPRTPAIRVGDPVLFRPAKAGEPAEWFDHYLLVDGDTVVREPTYRGIRRAGPRT